MTRALLVLLLALVQMPLAAATRMRAVSQPGAPPAAIVAAAKQAAESAIAAGVPGVQVAVSRHGRVIYAGAFGVTDKANAIPTTTRSVMQIASVTKQFTAAAILRLAERGVLSLDDRVETYVPEFNNRGVTITLRHLLNHTSGVKPNWYLPTPNGLAPPAPVTRAYTLQTLNSQAFDSLPGAKWSYSNAGYLLLGYTIESVTGQPYAEFIQNEFALPLGLLDTGVCGTSNLPLPEGYGLLGGTWTKMTPLHHSVMLSAGGLCSTAADLARWSHLLAKGYALQPASYAEMTTPAKLSNNNTVPGNYALGIVPTTTLGHPAVWHSGAIDGFQSYLLYFANQDLAVAVITNGFPGGPGTNPQSIATAVASAALIPNQ